VTIYNIKGEVESIERKNGKTEVLVSDNNGSNVSTYSLNEALIDFGFALEARDLEKAAMILDSSELNN
jgi:intraflagellar transport protein 172